MSNPANSGHLIGRLGRGGVKSFQNSDGSQKLVFNLGVDENFLRSGKSEPDTDFIPVQAFIPAKANGIGSWANVHEGDLIAIDTRLSYKPYVKDGQRVFPDGVTVEVEGYPKYLEPKSVTEARAARKAAEATAPAPVAETQEEELARLRAQVAAQGATDASEHPFG